MSARPFACAAIAGIALAASIGDTTRALVALPPLAIALFGAACATLALRLFSARTSATMAAAAVAAIALLPGSLPVGHVLTRAAGHEGSADLFRLLDDVDAAPQRVLGTRASVSGTWMPAQPPRAATVSRRIMACCAADAVDVGLDVLPAPSVRAGSGQTVCVSGVVSARIIGGELRYALVRALVRERPCR
ncbi:MAG: hypothetical protein JO219_05150 [Candidatus Eremiobacteraeota bacterium]|nr:hypothetical protein [Candidatus Eremiobacteraeota bacterium]MBV8366787.1 hypothetical protein [Candidatus Eremiobacteraeota bacterium]